MANIKVAVRVRPISVRELNLTGSEVVVRTQLNEISLTNLKVSSSKAGDSRERIRRYGFDYCFDSSDPEAKNYATQATIYETLGQSILDAMFTGYNSCLVAYGQSASGKTYTMMGTKEDPGLIPRLCEGLFSRVEKEDGRGKIYRVTVSYLEIYNERVRDLLKPSATASGLRVREHPRLGPYVQGLTHHVVRTLGSLMSYVEEGTKARKTAPTLQNPTSSRSHALLTVGLSQEAIGGERPGGGISSSRRQDTTPRDGSRLHLVDLAGSESAATCGGVHRLKEGANINKSLVALGNVISALAERTSTGSGAGRRYIPYRDSSLTWLLKDALGGNATTIMLATISPASGSYNETAHTLRFAQRAQSVVNRPVVNEDPVARLICELRNEVARLKSLLHEKDIDQRTKLPCCCGKGQSSQNSATELQCREEQSSCNTLRSEEESENRKNDDSVQAKDEQSVDVLSIRRSNSSDSVTTYETGSSASIRKFSSYEHLRLTDRFVSNYNRAKVTELNDEEDEVVDEINEPVFVDIPTLVAVLIKPDESLQESSTQIEEICSDEVQEDSIDADFIEDGNEDFETSERIDDIDSDDRKDTLNCCDALDDSGIGEFHPTLSECPPSSPTSDARSRPKGKFNKQNSVDLPSSNLDVSRQFGSIEGISKRKDPILSLQRSHTNLEKRSQLPDRGKKLNNIREIDDHKAGGKSSNIWKAFGNVGSKDHLQRKSSNDSDKSLKDSTSSKNGYTNIGRKPSLESLKRKTSKDSSSSSSKEEQILISSLARDKLQRRKDSLEQESPGGVRHHTAIQRVKRADIVAAVTERLYSSRKHTEEVNMATSNTSDTRSPPEGNDAKVPSISSGFAARTKLQEISRKMLLKRRRINVETQTEAPSTLRLRDTASLTEEPMVVLQDVAVLTEDHTGCEMIAANHRLPVLRVKDIATLTDRPRSNIFRCRDVGSLANDLDFEDYELHSPRNDSGVLSDDTHNYAESNLSIAGRSGFYAESERQAVYTDSSTNTYSSSPGRNSAVQTSTRQGVTSQQKSQNQNQNQNLGCNQCGNLTHEAAQHAPANPEKNVISISLPDMISITIESTNGLESRIAVMEATGELADEKARPASSDKGSQTDKQVTDEVERSFLKDLSVRSTAVQADGRVFRIENIFQDPKSKSHPDAMCDLRKETATKRSVTFRNSLGTSSIFETRRSETETEWDRTCVQDVRQKKRSILKGSLTRAFIARKRCHSLSPRRPAHRLVHDLWKNWTLPCSGRASSFIDYCRETVDDELHSFVQRGVNSGSVDDLRPSALMGDCTPDKISEEIIHESSGQIVSDFDDKKTESAATKNLLDCDNNFSDDSLDYDENDVAVKSIGAKIVDSRDRESYENLCPPDVVAHTKKEASKPANHVDSVNVQSPGDDDFDDTTVEIPRRKPTEASDKDLLHEYKSLILGASSYLVSKDREEDANAKTSGATDSVGKKKVSFSNPSSPDEMKDVAINREILQQQQRQQQQQTTPKSIIKKTKKKKPGTAENLDIVQLNIEADQLSQREKTEKSTKSERVPPASKENRKSVDPEEPPSDKKPEFLNGDCFEEPCSESDSVVSDEDAGFHAISRKNIFEEYLSEMTTFMRNMNSINEYMSAHTVESYGKRRKRRKDRQRGSFATTKDYVKSRGRRVNLKDDTDRHLQSDKDEAVPVESYEKCLKSIERLETCIDKVNKQNHVLQDKYGIDVESAGAKSCLASPSVDSRVSSVAISDAMRNYEDVVLKNGVTVSSPLSSSIRTDVTRQFVLNGRDRREIVTAIDKHDPDDKSNDLTSDDDFERRIYNQLMDAADSSSSCWYRNTRQPRRKRLWKMSDLRSHSPTTYSKFRETFRQVARGILNFDEVPEDYLDDTRGIESSQRDFRRAIPSGFPAGDIESRTLIEPEIDPDESRDRNKLSAGDSGVEPLEIRLPNEPTILTRKVEYLDCLIDPTSSVETERAYCEKDKIARKNAGSKDSLRVDSMNYRFGGSLSMELKYPGSPRAKFLELLRERRRIVENSRGTNAF